MKPIERLRQEYKEIIKFADWSEVKREKRESYQTMRLFCIDCSLLSFAEIEKMENEVEQLSLKNKNYENN
jgi:hypothetical protein